MSDTTAPVQYIGNLGICWCVKHSGVINEGTVECDKLDRTNDAEYDEDGYLLPCDPRDLAYIAVDGALP